MSRKVSIFSVVILMIVTVMATVAVAFAAQGESENGPENEGDNGQGKVTLCHNENNPHTITVGAPAKAAHLAHGDTEGPCADESTTEPPTGTVLTTDSIDSATLPNSTISDTATLSGATSDATGTITFSAYGPFDPTADPTTDVCDETTLAYESPDPIDIGSPDENGDYVVSSDDPTVTTDDFAPSDAGRYQWVASFTSGDTNAPISTKCNDANEQSIVNEAGSTNATGQNMTLVAETGDTATLAQGNKDPDITNGTDQRDSIAGGGGRDLIRGLLDGDQLYGDNGADTLFGNADDDFLQGGSGPDAISGGPGDDYIDSVDGKAGNDETDGGAGTDYCVGDEGDTFTNCDGNVVEVTAPAEVPTQTEASQ